jgi:uncharacterized protein (TIGR03000 family)
MKKLAVCAVVTAVALSSASTAQAGGWLLWWQVNRMHNYHAGRAPYGSYYGAHGSAGFSCWGSLPRVFAHRFAHWHGPHHGHGPLWGHGGGPAWMNWQHGANWGGDGYDSIGHYGDGEVVHGNGYPLHGEWGGEGAPSTGPALPPPMGEELVPPPAPPKDKGSSIRFRLSVPADAVVFVNDELTISTGELRQYVSRNVKAGSTYSYTIRAEVMRDGQLLSQVKTLKLIAGDEQNLAFNFPQHSEKPTTALILRVPDDARVILSGVDTKSTGAEREFVTKLLSEAQWSNYTVRVELERRGRTLVHEQTVTLNPGDRREVTIDFAAEVASSR